MKIKTLDDMGNIQFLFNTLIKCYPIHRNKKQRDKFVDDVREFMIFWGREYLK